METIDIIKKLCSGKGITISQLESELHYGNGSISKSKNMSAERMYEIAKYFGVSMEYLITGSSLEETDSEIAVLRQKQSILMEINRISQNMVAYYQKMMECQAKITVLKKEYNKLDGTSDKESPDSLDEDNDSIIGQQNLFDIMDSNEFPKFFDV